MVEARKEGKTHLACSIQDFQDTGDTLVVNYLLISVFDGGIVLNHNIRKKGSGLAAVEGMVCLCMVQRAVSSRFESP